MCLFCGNSNHALDNCPWIHGLPENDDELERLITESRFTPDWWENSWWARNNGASRYASAARSGVDQPGALGTNEVAAAEESEDSWDTLSVSECSVSEKTEPNDRDSDNARMANVSGENQQLNAPAASEEVRRRAESESGDGLDPDVWERHLQQVAERMVTVVRLDGTVREARWQRPSKKSA